RIGFCWHIVCSHQHSRLSVYSLNSVDINFNFDCGIVGYPTYTISIKGPEPSHSGSISSAQLKTRCRPVTRPSASY
ncbi:MAG: hypothetical protein WDA42_08645, partial [Candidatus Bathyarchaeia archaeon]